MSLSAQRFTSKSSKSVLLFNQKFRSIIDLEGELYESSCWDLSQEEADKIENLRKNEDLPDFESFIKDLKIQGKSAGARYIASRIYNGASTEYLHQLTIDWLNHRNIITELTTEEMQEIGVSPIELRFFGIRFRSEARSFYDLYSKVHKKNRAWNSSKQINKGKVKAIALTKNYNKLPLWVKKTMIQSDIWIESGNSARIGNIWRFCDCARAWKHAPSLPKGIAEKVGKMSVKARVLADLAWNSINCPNNFRELHMQWTEWHLWGVDWIRSEISNKFWGLLKELLGMSLPQLIYKFIEVEERISTRKHNQIRSLIEMEARLPHGYLFQELGRARDACRAKYLNVYIKNQSIEKVTKSLFGSTGKTTIKAFTSASDNSRRWAIELCGKNPDIAQKMLRSNLIEFEPEVVDFLKALPLSSQMRLLQCFKFKYRGEIHDISKDHIRDTGYLWNNLKNKPKISRARCWFSLHELLSTAFVEELPDEDLPISPEWKRIDGLCSINGLWSLEIPKRVADLKYYGSALSNCVGAYGNAIKSGRSVIVIIREYGLITHCVEILSDRINQFYKANNSSPDPRIQGSVILALQQAKLLR